MFDPLLIIIMTLLRYEWNFWSDSTSNTIILVCVFGFKPSHQIDEITENHQLNRCSNFKCICFIWLCFLLDTTKDNLTQIKPKKEKN